LAAEPRISNRLHVLDRAMFSRTPSSGASSPCEEDLRPAGSLVLVGGAAGAAAHDLTAPSGTTVTWMSAFMGTSTKALSPAGVAHGFAARASHTTATGASIVASPPASSSPPSSSSRVPRPRLFVMVSNVFTPRWASGDCDVATLRWLVAGDSMTGASGGTWRARDNVPS
jgi:hypothetical protein